MRSRIANTVLAGPSRLSIAASILAFVTLAGSVLASVSYGFESDTIGQTPSGWTSNVGIWQIQDDRAYSGSKSLKITASKDRGRAIADTVYTDVTVQAKVYFASSSDKPGLILRSDANATSYYRFFFNAGTLYIQSVDATIASTSYTLPAAGDWYNIKAQASGSTLRLKIWQTSEPEPSTWNLETTDNALSSGRIGVFSHLTTGSSFDDVVVTEPQDEAPTISTLSPTDDATDVSIDTTLQITFDNNIGNSGTGYVTIYKASDDSVIALINTATGAVTGSGTATVTITPPASLDINTRYYVQIDANAFPDEFGNYFAGISDDTIWDFTTVDPAVSVSASVSTVAASPAVVDADGNSISTITVTAKNTSGTTLSGKVVTLESDGGGSISPASDTTDADGQAQFTVSSSSPGTETFSATAGGVAISQTATVTFADVLTETSIAYTSTLDNLSLRMDVAYNNGISDAPIILVLHGYSGPFGGQDIIQRFAERGLFAIKTYKRSFGGSAGTPDDSAREIHDFIDAIEYVKANYGDYVDPSNINVVGYSGGGGNVYGLATKFPDYFRTANVFFGMSDYGYDDTYGWWNNGGGSYRTPMQSRIGGAPSEVRNNYYARAHHLAAKNNPYTHIELFYDTSESTCPVSHAMQYLKTATGAGLTNVEANISTSSTTVTDLDENFATDVTDWSARGSGATLYTWDNAGHLEWTSVTSSTYHSLYKSFDSLRSYSSSDHIKAEFDLRLTSTPSGGSVLVGMRRGADASTNNGVAFIILNNGSKFDLYARVDYNGTPLISGNRTLQQFSTQLLLNTTYRLSIDLNNGSVTAILKDSGGTTLETESLTLDGTKTLAGIDTFGVYNYNDGIIPLIPGEVDNVSVTAWARWTHGYPQEGDEEGNITAENLFVPDILAETYDEPVLSSSGSMFLPGYVKTKEFRVMLNEGQTDAADLTYDVSGDASTLANAKTFTLEDLSDTAPTVSLHLYDLSPSTEYLVRDQNISEGTESSSIVTTTGTGVLVYTASLGSTHTYSIHSDTTAPEISSLSPANNATDVSLTANLALGFNETVATTGTGTVTIMKASDDSIVELIAVTGSLVTGSGTDTITIDPSNTLAYSTSYYVQISPNAFPDVSGNFYAGISDSTSWNFTTSAAPSMDQPEQSVQDNTAPSSGGGSRGGTDSATMQRRIAQTHALILSRYEQQLQADAEEDDIEDEFERPDIFASDKQREFYRAAQKVRQAEQQAVAQEKVFRIADQRGRLLAYVDDSPVLYRDVPTKSWYAPYVSALIEQEIAQGYADSAGNPTGEFGVSNPVTYAEVLKMAYTAAGTTLPQGSPANASGQDTWAANYVLRAEMDGLPVIATDLNVHDAATRGEVVTLILAVLDIPTQVNLGLVKDQYSDLPSSHPYAQALMTATLYGLIGGDTAPDGTYLNTVRPDDFINRAEVAKIVALLRELLKD